MCDDEIFSICFSCQREEFLTSDHHVFANKNNVVFQSALLGLGSIFRICMLIKELRPSQGAGTCSLRKNGLVPQKQNLDFLCSLFPKIACVPLFPLFLCLCSPVLLKKKMPLFLKTPGRASELSELPQPLLGQRTCNL